MAKVLLLNLWRIINSKGGTEKVFCNMANALSERGYEVVAVGFENKEGKPFFEISSSVKFINAGYGFTWKRSLFQKLIRNINLNKEKRHLYDESIIDPPIAEKLRPVIENEKPDIIISYNIEATRILMNLLKVTCPVITMFHYDAYTLLHDATVNTIKALESCKYVQVLLPGYVKIVKQYLKTDNIIVVPNMVSQEKCVIGGGQTQFNY